MGKVGDMSHTPTYVRFLLLFFIGAPGALFILNGLMTYGTSEFVTHQTVAFMHILAGIGLFIVMFLAEISYILRNKS